MSEWEKVRLGDVCEISAGGTPSRNVIEYWKDGTIPWVKISDMSGKYVSSTEEMITEVGLENSSAHIFPKGTILYSIFASIGNVGILTIDAATNQAIVGMKFIEKYDLSFLYYLLLSLKENFEKISRGIAQKNINQSILKNTIIPLPPLSEQKKIADRLDKVSELIALRKKQAELLDKSVKARFAEMFGDPVTNPMGWDSKSFTDVCVSIYGGGTPSKNHPEYFKGNIPWVSPKDMKSIIIIDSIDHINETAIKNSSTKIVPKNSILMVIRSGILKHSLPVGINIVPVTINQDMKAFIPNKKIKSTYLLYYFKAIEKDVLTKVRGVTADNIDFKDFLNRKIPLPPLALQNEFAEFVTAVEKTKVPVIKSIEALETLKKSLMQEYFG